MPELPEVETIARGLAKRVTGDVIDSVWLGQKKEPLKSPAPEIAAVLEHSRIESVRRMGKHIVFDLQSNTGAASASSGGKLDAPEKLRGHRPRYRRRRARAPAPHRYFRPSGSFISA